MGEGSTDIGRRGFGRRRMAPRVGILDPKPYVRAFLADTFEELGFIPQCWDTLSDLLTSFNGAEPDLIVIVESDGEHDAHILELLAPLYHGRILLIGRLPALAAPQRRGEQLGLWMLPPLGTPFRTGHLSERVVDLLPAEPPPPLPVDLVEALGNGWLELWYQAKIDPHSLTPCGVEALIRLRHPSWGIVPPARFLPEADDPHFRALSDFVVLKAMMDWARFAIDFMPIEIAINLPAEVLTDPDFVHRMRRQLPDHPDFIRLVVEVDSRELISDLAGLREIVRELASYGIGLSIDNLGAECSSLSGLEGVPVFELKIARHVVDGCAEDRLKRALCATLLDTARRLGARTVAEGSSGAPISSRCARWALTSCRGSCSASRWRPANSRARCAGL